MPQQVTVSEYARLRGVSHTAVQIAIKNKRLVNSVTRDEKNRVRIDPVVANLEWKLNTDESKRFNVKNPDMKAAKYDPPPPFVRNPDPETAPASAGMMAGATFNQSRAVREAYQARLAKLEFEERSGKLIEKAAVENEAFKLARAVRDSLMNIPDRVAAEFAGLTDAHTIHLRLGEELRKALEALQE